MEWIKERLETEIRQNKLSKNLPLWRWDYGDGNYVINVGGSQSEKIKFKLALESALQRDVDYWREGLKITKNEAAMLGFGINKNDDGKPLSKFLLSKREVLKNLGSNMKNIERIASDILKESMASIPRQDIQAARTVLLRLYKNKEISHSINDKLGDVIHFLMLLETNKEKI